MILPEYFTDAELQCKCGCGKMPVKKFVFKLYALRILYNRPIKLTSCARCVTHNKNEGGAKKSMHLKGAGDCKIEKVRRWWFILLAMLCGFRGIGIHKKFIHIDARLIPAIWTY